MAMNVIDFQDEIFKAARLESGGVSGLSPLPQIFGVAAFVAGALYTIDWFGNLWYHVLGFSIAVGAVILIRYGIEEMIASRSRDPRFSEYGLLAHFEHDYNFLIRKKAGRWGMILTLKPMAKIAFSGFLPPYGISILVMVPFDYLEMRKTAKIIDRSFEMGDQVEGMIRAGSIEDEVRGYLSGKKR